MEYNEHEIKIVYREQVNMDGTTYLPPYKVSCEGLYSGYGYTLEQAMKAFDNNNKE